MTAKNVKHKKLNMVQMKKDWTTLSDEEFANKYDADVKVIAKLRKEGLTGAELESRFSKASAIEFALIGGGINWAMLC